MSGGQRRPAGEASACVILWQLASKPEPVLARRPFCDPRCREPALWVSRRRLCGVHDSTISDGHDHSVDAAIETVA
jgi:hypothetical protein